MGHQLDTTNGVTSFADSQNDAWHQLGQQVGHKMTVDEALDAAHMKGWNVRKLPLLADVAERHDSDGNLLEPQPEPRMVPVPDRFTIVRDNPITKEPQALGVTGRWWKPFANEATTALLGEITDKGGAHLETLGSLDGGRRTFATMLMPDHMTLTTPTGLLDTTKLYLAVFNNHDAQGALRALISPTRVVCANTQAIAERNAISEVKIRHTGEMDIKLEEVRRILGLTFKYQEVFAAQMEAMSKQYRDDEWVRNVLNDVFEVDEADSDKQRVNRIETTGKIMEVYRQDDTVNMWQGTTFGAYNAVTRYLDHYMPIGNTKTKRSAETGRALRTISSKHISTLKGRAAELLSA